MRVSQFEFFHPNVPDSGLSSESGGGRCHLDSTPTGGFVDQEQQQHSPAAVDHQAAAAAAAAAAYHYGYGGGEPHHLQHHPYHQSAQGNQQIEKLLYYCI